MALASESPEFNEFCQTANALKGGAGDIDRSWLLEMWTGADCDPNRAVNHLIDTPDDKVKRGGSAGGGHKSHKAGGGSSKSLPRKGHGDSPSATLPSSSGSLSKSRSKHKSHTGAKSGKHQDHSGFPPSGNAFDAKSMGFNNSFDHGTANSGGGDPFQSSPAVMQNNWTSQSPQATAGMPNSQSASHWGSLAAPPPSYDPLPSQAQWGSQAPASSMRSMAAPRSAQQNNFVSQPPNSMSQSNFSPSLGRDNFASQPPGSMQQSSFPPSLSQNNFLSQPPASVSQSGFLSPPPASTAWGSSPNFGGSMAGGAPNTEIEAQLSQLNAQIQQTQRSLSSPASQSAGGAFSPNAWNDGDSTSGSEDEWWHLPFPGGGPNSSRSLSGSRAPAFGTSAGGAFGTSLAGSPAQGGFASGAPVFASAPGFGTSAAGGFGSLAAGGFNSAGGGLGGFGANGGGPMDRLRQLLAFNARELDAIVMRVYGSVVTGGRGGHGELVQVAQMVTQQAELPAAAFHNLEVMHERFDFSGDGSLDVGEMSHLIRGCVRAHQKQVDPQATRAKDMNLPRKKLEDHFTVVKKLGEGGQGAMYLVSMKTHQDEMRCVKFYDKSNANAPLDDIKEEFELMRRLNSPLVARTFEIFEDLTHVYLVNEPYFGGDLTKLIANAAEAGVNMNEDWFRTIFLQPVQGIQYINQQHLMHCDLKEANVMVANDSNWNHPRVVLIDFGLATNFTDSLQGVSGTPGYIPPETWQKNYWVPKGDVFSLGVMFFQLLGGVDQLFAGFMDAKTVEDVARHTCSTQPPFQRFDPKPEFQQLVVRMLEKDPRGRCTINETSQHSWFRNMTGAPIDPHVVQSIQKFNHRNETQLKVAELMLDRFNIGGLQQLNQAFLAMDRDMSGTVTVEEARGASQMLSQQFGMSSEQIEAFIYGMSDNSGNVSYKRFMGAMIQQQKGFSTADLEAKFRELDVDGNGVLDDWELLQVVRKMGYPEHESRSMLQTLDRNGDGKVTFDEFKRAMIGT